MKATERGLFARRDIGRDPAAAPAASGAATRRGPLVRRRVFLALLAAAAVHLLVLVVPIGQGPAGDDPGKPAIHLRYHAAVETPPLSSREPTTPPSPPEERATAGAIEEAPTGEPAPESALPGDPRGAVAVPPRVVEASPARDDTPAPVPERIDIEETSRVAPEALARAAPSHASKTPDRGLEEVDLMPADRLAELAADGSAEHARDPAPGVTSTKPPDERTEGELADEVQRRLAGFVRDEKAHHRVDTGLVDPYFVRLRESFGREFAPEWEHFDEEAREGLLEDVAAWLRDYQGSMERYGATGSPYREGESSSLPRHDAAAHPVAPSGTLAAEDGRLDLARQTKQHRLRADLAAGRAGGVELVAVLRVVQSQSGRLLRVEIERTSGKPVYDSLARSTIREALSRHRPPSRLGQGLGLTSDRIESVWAFRTRFVVVPPTGVTCEIDSDGAGGECLRPLQRRALHEIELRAVY